MQAITTKYNGPTNTRGSTIKASCDAKTKLFAYDTSLTFEQNHKAAAMALIKQLNWGYGIASGQMKCGKFAHVLIEI